MPVYEMPTTTPELEIETQNGEMKKLRIDMCDLAGISRKENRFADVQTLIKDTNVGRMSSRESANGR